MTKKRLYKYKAGKKSFLSRKREKKNFFLRVRLNNFTKKTSIIYIYTTVEKNFVCERKTLKTHAVFRTKFIPTHILTFYVRKYFPKRFKNIVHNTPEPGGKYLT